MNAVEHVIIKLFAALVPEHERAIEELWATYRPDVQTFEDSLPAARSCDLGTVPLPIGHGAGDQLSFASAEFAVSFGF